MLGTSQPRGFVFILTHSFFPLLLSHCQQSVNGTLPNTSLSISPGARAQVKALSRSLKIKSSEPQTWCSHLSDKRKCDAEMHVGPCSLSAFGVDLDVSHIMIMIVFHTDTYNAQDVVFAESLAFL